ncbi:MAG: UspA domain-containing protein [Caulobacteraceae bacterium]|nr:MAG: UspA domain-containing protein [Caulobacteraceae bacterium]
MGEKSTATEAGQATAGSSRGVRRILVALDFSPHSDRALDLALGLAAPLGAEVHALHVCVLLAHALLEGAHPDAPDFEASVKAGIDQRLANLQRDTSARGQKLVTHRVDGNPAECVLSEATRLGADLIVVGTHGHSGLDRVLLGSVAERVVRLSKVPVLTVH